MIPFFTSPHDRAERLIDDRLDAERGDPSPQSAADAAWLQAHLADCERCAQVERERRGLFALLTSMPEMPAPEGFAERLRLRAAAENLPSSTPEAAGLGALWRRAPVRWASAAAAAAVLAAGVMMAPGGRVDPPSADEVKVGGAVRIESGPAHFVIRAPTEGAARFRVVADAVVKAHAGQMASRSDALEAVIPRSELVAFMAELERRGGFEVDLARELEEEATQVVLRFDLD